MQAGSMEKEALSDTAHSSEKSETPPGKTPVPVISDFDNDEISFDHGWKAWSQVVASFFLFFNTWYAIDIPYRSSQGKFS